MRKLVQLLMIAVILFCSGYKSINAEDNNDSLVLGSKYLTEENYLYFGNYKEEPVHFMVLNNDGYVYSTYILDRLSYNDTWPFAERNIWIDSWAEEWCEESFYGGFNDAEKYAVVSITKTDPAYSNSGTDYLKQYLENDHAYFLSAEEIETYFPEPEKRSAYMLDGTQPNYWTRSPAQGYGVLVGNVIQNSDTYAPAIDSAYTNILINLGCGHYLGARPALNIDKEKVLFMSVYEGDKISGEIGENCLRKIDKTDNDTWKLTVEDPNSEFNAILVSLENNTAVIEYDNAYTGTDGFVSAVITDNDNNIIYYGNLVSDSLSGRANLVIPEECLDESYCLKVFTERKNGSKKTDYGKMSLEYPFDNYCNVIFDSAGGSKIASQKVKQGEKCNEPENPVKQNCEFVGWYLDGEAFDFDTAIESDITLLAHWEENQSTFEIRYDLSGGSYNGKTDAIVEKHEKGSLIRIHEAPEREGYKFVCWQGSSYQPGDEYTVESDHVFTAIWDKISNNPVNRYIIPRTGIE